MHEVSLVQSLLDLIEEQRKIHDFSRVTSITLSFGRLSCVEPQTLGFAFEIQSQSTVAEGAALHFDIQPVVLYCFGCTRDSRIEKFPADCSWCGSPEVVVVEGTEELRLVEMDVE
ncbi:MAG: hydrogenase maturation nickel metallochaperone HypA [Deltaproteobacteria bacterium]|nr:hydrogenase maturation nickel metallochaperone HypA [Deltaproteobacteria bacterium]